MLEAETLALRVAEIFLLANHMTRLVWWLQAVAVARVGARDFNPCCKTVLGKSGAGRSNREAALQSGLTTIPCAPCGRHGPF